MIIQVHHISVCSCFIMQHYLQQVLAQAQAHKPQAQKAQQVQCQTVSDNALTINNACLLVVVLHNSIMT